jgi:hypothetical protein
VAAAHGAGRGADQGVAPVPGESAVRVGEPRGQGVVDPGAGDRAGEERGGRGVRLDHAAGGVGDERG